MQRVNLIDKLNEVYLPEVKHSYLLIRVKSETPDKETFAIQHHEC